MMKLKKESISKALRKTARNLKEGKPYEWGHMGSCNCGNLAQTVLNLKKEEIHLAALEKTGDWNEQLNDYCPTSGFKVDQLIWGLMEFGFSQKELMHLENLSDPYVLKAIPTEKLPLERNNRQHVIMYIETWASLIEKEIREEIKPEKKYSLHELDVLNPTGW